METVAFTRTVLTGGFWKRYEDLVRQVSVPAIYDQFERSGRFAALQCRKELESHIYWDSDVAKWMEAAAYLIQRKPAPELEKAIDEAVALIVKNQLPNGYFNAYYISQMPENIFTVRDNHELYCAGHLMEAAIAYDQATGKHDFLQAMLRYGDFIYQVFFLDKSAGFVTPGHEEIELALLKLAEYTGIAKYRDLAAYFIQQRGRHPLEVCAKKEDSQSQIGEYYRWLTQSMQPVREMTHAYGHAVRAGYLYTAMADLARQTADQELLDVCKGLFRDIITTKLSITGGVGAQLWGEAYGLPYRLSNRDNYNETCAAISLAMFAWELLRQDLNSAYGDVIERILFNALPCGISLQGDGFFYENPLEIDLRDYDLSTRAFGTLTPGQCHNRGLLHNRRLQRAKVFTCSCCPPNISRMMASITRFMYSVDNNTIYCHQFAEGQTQLTVNGQKATLKLVTNYPCDGTLRYTYHGPDARLAIRIPGWCAEYTGATENGYAMLTVEDGSTVELTLPMQVHFIESDPQVSELAGKYAVTRGPIVYCLESVDNGQQLWDIQLDPQSQGKLLPSDQFGVPILEMDAVRRPPSKALYQIKTDERKCFTAKLIPYFAFANRGISNMQIWTQLK